MSGLRPQFTRRQFGRLSASAAALGELAPRPASALPAPGVIPPGERPPQDPSVLVLNPRGRVPLSFIIDDSTCLVNLAHFAMPQFAEAFPDRPDYRKDWRSWPREIPDAFVRKFGEWCASRGVKGKYSIVPYPACVGWVGRVLPGWSRAELRDSLQLVRDLMVPDWDIHPEMVTHTRLLDLKSGQPVPEATRATMENWFPAAPVSRDFLASYLTAGLRGIEEAGLPCEGFTTPGGFGNSAESDLSLAAQEALGATFRPEVPHYFKYLTTDPNESTAPRVEHVSGLAGGRPDCTVNVVAGTGDWFGGWDGVTLGDPDASVDRLVTADGVAGRMVEMIDRAEPAIMLCHWPGIYCNGLEVGFEVFRRAVDRLDAHFSDQTRWMKLSEIARYWAAKELTSIRETDGSVDFGAPFACPSFTVRVPTRSNQPPGHLVGGEGEPVALRECPTPSDLVPGTWCRASDEPARAIACFDLPRGRSTLRPASAGA